MIDRSDVEVTQRIVSVLTVEQIRNALEHVAGSGANDEFGPEYLALVRRMRWRRGLMEAPRIQASLRLPL